MATEGQGLFDNNLFLQLLSAAGQDIGQGNAIGTNVNNAVQQNVQSQSHAKLMADILSGKHPGSKLTADDDKITFNMPKNAFKLDTGTGGFDTGGATSGNMQKKDAPMDLASMGTGGGGGTTPNPFSSISETLANLKPEDLAGLTPEMLNSIVGTGINVKQYNLESVAKAKAAKDEAEYRRALTNEAIARTNKMGQTDPLDQPHPIQLSGEPELTTRQFNSLPDDEKRYRVYVEGANRLGESEIMSRREFELLNPTEQEKTMRAYLKDEDLLNTALKLRHAGSSSTNIYAGDPVQKKVDLGKVEGLTYFSSPNWTEDLDKFINSKEFTRSIPVDISLENEPKYIEEQKLQWIQNKIESQGGVVESAGWLDSMTPYWDVMWESGGKEYRRRVRYDLGR